MYSQPPKNAQGLERNEGTKCSRRWTTSQLQRKRQLDRESQRVAREKTKNRISYLEGLVKSFQENDDDRIQKLLKKIDDQAAEIQRLRDVIRGINRLIEGSNNVCNAADSFPEPKSSGNNNLPVIGDIDAHSIIEETPHESLDSLYEPTEMESETTIPFNGGLTEPEDQALASVSHHSLNEGPHTIAQLAASIAEDRLLDGRLWYLAGGVLNYLLHARDTDLPVSTCDDEDIAIRAVFEGWSAVTERYCLDSGWQWLKELDERIYHHLSPPNRLMHMRNTRLIFVNQVSPSADIQRQIPPFFAAQSFKSHIKYSDPLAEHFPWPGFRRRLSSSPLKFATDKFMDALRTYVDFTWNQDAQSLFTRNPLDGRYQYSDNLVQRMGDIRCYAAKHEFFHAFPELKADIPCSAVSLRSLLPLVQRSDIQADGETPPIEYEQEDGGS